MFYTVIETVTPTSNPQTVFQASPPANQRVKILGVDVGFQGSTPATAPIRLDWIIQTTSGTASAATPQLQDRGLDETVQATLQKTFTAEPTSGSILIDFSIHEQGTAFWRPPFNILVKGSERVGLRYKSGTFVQVTFTIYLEE